MNKVSKLATKVVASTAAGIAGIAAVVVLAAPGSTAVADGVCPDDMHWVVCPPLDEVTDTVTDVLRDDMHW